LASTGTTAAYPYDAPIPHVPPPWPRKMVQLLWRVLYIIGNTTVANKETTWSSHLRSISPNHIWGEGNRCSTTISILPPLHTIDSTCILDLITIGGIVRLFGIDLKIFYTMFMILDLIRCE
jgi:hypothetical protein